MLSGPIGGPVLRGLFTIRDQNQHYLPLSIRQSDVARPPGKAPRPVPAFDNIMNDSALRAPSSAPGAHLASRSQTVSGSTSQRLLTDDLLTYLTPRTAVDAFQNPAGTLKLCMDATGPTEQAFALRTAMASQKVLEWLEELSTWSWPAGVEEPTDQPADRGRCAVILLAEDAARYENRIEAICQDMADLDLEELKTHVLHSHILPLSRPGSPKLASSRTAPLAWQFVKMNDFSAVITATILQALPNLSKLTMLISAWSLRLALLRTAPVFFKSLADAESALQSNKIVIHDGSKGQGAGQQPDHESVAGKTYCFSWHDFKATKLILEQKVVVAARHLDSVLVSLQDRPETLPRAWIDRMDAVERKYGEWVALCERKIWEAEWIKVLGPRGPAHRWMAVETDGQHVGIESWQTRNKVADTPLIKVLQNQDADAGDFQQDKLEAVTANGEEVQLDGAGEPHKTRDEDAYEHIINDTDLPDGEDFELMSPKEALIRDGARQDLDVELDDPIQLHIPEPQLLICPRPRREGVELQLSTAMHDSLPGAMEFSSDPPDHGTPEYHRLRWVESVKDAALASDDVDVSSSPPQLFRPSPRALSLGMHNMATVKESPSEATPQLESVMADEESARDAESPSQLSLYSTADHDQLDQQIQNILDSVPATIRLTSERCAIGLNPADLKMPTRSAALKPDPDPHSQSSLMAKSPSCGTPSFLLAPAYSRNARSRNRGNQDIKLYHLSRPNGEAPIKLFIRCVGENSDRVMVRVGGGWADLGEYLKEYALHHGRWSGQAGESRVEARDMPASWSSQLLSSVGSATGTGNASINRLSPPLRPASALDSRPTNLRPITPLKMRKTRRSIVGAAEDAGYGSIRPSLTPNTPLATNAVADRTPHSGSWKHTSPEGASTRSRSSSHLSWSGEEESSLGLAGPRGKKIEMSDESKAWVESIKERVRLASGEHLQRSNAASTAAVGAGDADARRDSATTVDAGFPATDLSLAGRSFGELGKVGGTRRVFWKQFG